MKGVRKIWWFLGLLVVGLCWFFDESQAASSFDCCLRYRKHPLRIAQIKGFSEQRSNEACDIDAIIFFTAKHKVCADPKEPWVKNRLKTLSTAKHKKTSK